MSRIPSASHTTSTPRKIFMQHPSLTTGMGMSPVQGKGGPPRSLGSTMSPVLESPEYSALHSTLPEEDSGFFSFTECVSQSHLLYSEDPSSPPPVPVYSGSTSPTMEQALLMYGQHPEDQRYWKELYTQNTEADYDLTQLVRAMKLESGILPSPLPDSPTFPTHCIASSTKLFGPLPSALPSPSRPRLPSKPDPAREEIQELLTSSPPKIQPLHFSSSETQSSSPSLETQPPSSPSLVTQTPSSLPNVSPSLTTEAPQGTWSGQLPAKTHRNPTFSNKIFLGGVPWDITESSLVQAFKQFGPIRIEWPGKDTSPSPPKGYVYIIFEYEQNVPLLLSQCTHDFSDGSSWYFRISSHRMRSKEVQIIPWVLADSNYVLDPKQRLDPQKTVFVGGLHGMLNAEGLATIFKDLFGGVVYAGIDTDKHRYPIGSGRVTFNNSNSYMMAVAAAFVDIKCQKFSKKVQVDPYLEDSLCSLCLLKQGPYFCRDLRCFQYFCRFCWESHHSTLRHHKPLMRNTRSGGGPATRPTISLTPPHPACDHREGSSD